MTQKRGGKLRMRGHSCGNADVTNSQRGVECKLILAREEREREREISISSLLPSSPLHTARSVFASETDILYSRNATPSPILVALMMLVSSLAMATALRPLSPWRAGGTSHISTFVVSSPSLTRKINYCFSFLRFLPKNHSRFYAIVVE